MNKKFASILSAVVTVIPVILLISTLAYAGDKESAKPLYIAQAEEMAPVPIEVPEVEEEEEVGYYSPFTGFNPVRKYVTGGLMRLFPKLEIRGTYWNYTELLVQKHFNPNFDYRPKNRGSQDFGKIENRLQIKYKYHLTDHEVLWGELVQLYDAVYDWENRDHVDPRGEQGSNFEWFKSQKRWFKEFFLESKRGPWTLRLGKQQVVWGKTDLIRVLDKVNPQDIREPISDQNEWDFTRLQTWMANIEYSFTPYWSLQFLWIPDFEPDRFAPPGNVYSPFTLLAFPPFFKLKSVDEPNDFADSEFGVRLSAQQVKGFDFTLNYLSAWKKTPTFFIREYQFPDPTSPIFTSFFVEPKHTRVHYTGFAVDKTINFGVGNQWLFRLEELVTINDYFSTAGEQAMLLPFDPATGLPLAGRHATLNDGVIKKNTLTSMINSEAFITMPFTGQHDWWWFNQIIHIYTFDWDRELLGFTGAPLKRSHWIYGTVLNKGFMADRGFFTCGWYGSLEGDNLYIANLTWEYTDDIKLTVGYEGTDGHPDDFPWGMWGETNDNFRFSIQFAF